MDPLAHTSFTSRTVSAFRAKDLIVGGLALVAWIFAFSAGILVNSQPFRDQLTQPGSLSAMQLLRAGVITFVSYTITNVAALCGISSLLGGLYKRSTKGVGVEPGQPALVMFYMPYLIQGFVVYLLLISGLLLFSEDPFSNLTQNKYIRLAGSASLLAFVSGYDPRLFVRLLERFQKFTETEKPAQK